MGGVRVQPEFARPSFCGLARRAFGGAASSSDPAAKVDGSLSTKPDKQTAVFAGGCSCRTQAVFERVKGVVATTVGYSGGAANTATYDQVVTETTGHAESVEVVYDSSRLTYGQLLHASFLRWPTIPRS